MTYVQRLRKSDMPEIIEWLGEVREAANSWAEMAEASRRFPDLTRALDSVAHEARRAQSLAEVSK